MNKTNVTGSEKPTEESGDLSFFLKPTNFVIIYRITGDGDFIYSGRGNDRSFIKGGVQKKRIKKSGSEIECRCKEKLNNWAILESAVNEPNITYNTLKTVGESKQATFSLRKTSAFYSNVGHFCLTSMNIFVTK